MPIVNLLSGKSFSTPEGKSILDSSATSTVTLPYSCKTGRCSTCKCKVITGETTALQAEMGLTAKEKLEGWILSCVRAAKTDVLLDVEDLDGITLPPIKTLPCRISHIEFLAADVIQVILRLPPTTDFFFIPGQYIDVIGPGGVRRSYSLANASFAAKVLELHIREVDAGVMSQYWFNEAKVNDLLRINGPLGTFFLRPSIAHRDLIFLATGTGFAPVKAILDSLKDIPQQMLPKTVNVFWGGRKLEDLYWKLNNFQPHFHFIPVLSRPHADWTGDKGYVQHAALSMHAELGNATVYACGSNEMIHSAKSVLTQAGLPVAHFYSDAFVCSATH
jgi:CDP-4-dehydro-6-deoxyglucose reductase